MKLYVQKYTVGVHKTSVHQLAWYNISLDFNNKIKHRIGFSKLSLHGANNYVPKVLPGLLNSSQFGIPVVLIILNLQ